MRVSKNIIRAMSLFVASKKELRFYLRSINFELHLDKTILAASDGTVLLSLKLDEPNDHEDNFMIEPHWFDSVKSDFYDIHKEDDGRVCIAAPNIKVYAPQNDVTYCDYRIIIPKIAEENPPHQYFDPERSSLFKKAAKLLGGNVYPLIHSNGLVDLGLPNCVGVQAALRCDGVESVFLDGRGPDWLLDTVRTQACKPKKEELIAA